MDYTITYDWLNSNEVDLDEFAQVLANYYGCDPDEIWDLYNEEAGGWVITSPDDNDNGLPDILDSLITDPVVTNKSQGGAWG